MTHVVRDGVLLHLPFSSEEGKWRAVDTVSHVPLAPCVLGLQDLSWAEAQHSQVLILNNSIHMKVQPVWFPCLQNGCGDLLLLYLKGHSRKLMGFTV